MSRPAALGPSADLVRQFASPAGAIHTLALDHRDALRNAFARAGKPHVTAAEMLELKARILAALAETSSSALLDTAALAHCRPPGKAIFVPIEEPGHRRLDGGRLTALIDRFGAADAVELGVQGCKLLLYYRADHAPTAARQRELARMAAADCRRHGLALVVEPKVYRLEGEPETTHARAFPELVAAAARATSPLSAPTCSSSSSPAARRLATASARRCRRCRGRCSAAATPPRTCS